MNKAAWDRQRLAAACLMLLVVAALGTILFSAAAPSSAATATTTYDTAAYTYDASSRLSPQDVAAPPQGCPATWPAASREDSVSSGRFGDAAKTAPGIKAASRGGENAGQISPRSVKNAVLDDNPNASVYCRMETDRPQVDHVIPRSRGGNATLENAQTTCWWCSASKGARDFPVNPPPGFEGMWPPSWWLLP